jgi:hypothetical protein
MKLIIIILFFHFSFILSAEKINIYHLDVPITNQNDYEFMKIIENEVEKNSINYNLWSEDFTYAINQEDTKRFKINQAQKTNKFRLTFETTSDLKTIHLIGFSMCYNFLKASAFDKNNPNRTDKFTIEPKYILPLSDYKEFINKTDMKRIEEILSNLLKYLIVQKTESYKSKEIQSYYFDFEESSLFDYIKDLHYDLYSMNFNDFPSKDGKSLSQDEIGSYICSVEDSSLSYIDVFGKTSYICSVNKFVGFEFGIDLKIERDSSQIKYSKSYLKIQLNNEYVGLVYESPNTFKPVRKILWIRKNELYLKMNNSNFEKLMEYVLVSKIFSILN